MRTREPDPERVALTGLQIRDLTCIYESSDAGIRDATFDVPAGSFTVVTGGVGAGKSTLLRALVGLEPSDGSVRWNGVDIADVAAWFVPPNAAHLPQVPRLFSESLAANIGLGRELGRLDTVLEQTTLTEDLAEMPEGSATTVGSRGLRLSGGQAQRVATARALLTKPELLVVDDLSSALDVKTERDLWQRLRDEGSSTVIAVSHRQFVIDQADQVITVEAGRVTSITHH
jgi:ATP-binding cassette subfamily B protein